MLLVPYDQLSEAALSGMMEEYVSRDGTDYGEQELSLDAKVGRLRVQLQRGQVVIVFDSETESCNLFTAEQFQQMNSAYTG
ncbi:MAG: YheU family protein [Pseudomonadales bacterium]